MITLYGIGNCDTVRKARRWLEANSLDYRFHDVRKDGLTRDRLTGWEKQVGWESLLNRRGTTWRKLPEGVRIDIDRSAALDIMLDQPAIIRRPVLDTGNGIHVGFSESGYQDLLG